MTASRSSGCLVMIVGPSGSGKDTLLDYAREELRSDPSFRFVRRVITRPVATGEAHEPVTAQEFARRADSDGFALHWEAHGLRYGIPAVVMKWIDEGCVVVTNGSRAIVDEARSRLPAVHVISITVPHAVLAERLLARGRENPQIIVGRLERARAFPLEGNAGYEIDNSGSPQAGGAALILILRSIKALSP